MKSCLSSAGGCFTHKGTAMRPLIHAAQRHETNSDQGSWDTSRFESRSMIDRQSPAAQVDETLSWSRFDQETKSVTWFCIQSTCNQLRLIVNLFIRKTSIAINNRNAIWMIGDCFCNICHKTSFNYFVYHPGTRNIKTMQYTIERRNEFRLKWLTYRYIFLCL